MEESSNRPFGGAESQDPFYRKLSAKVVHLATRAGLLPVRAEDVAQSVWLKFCKKFPDVTKDDAREHHRAWLLTAARHRIADALRAKRRLRTCSLDALNKEPKDSHEQTCAKRARDDAHSFLLRCWMEELSQSDPLTHELVWGRHVDGRSLAELVQRTGRDAHWISSRINRGLNKFRTWLGKHQNDGTVQS